MLRNFGTLIRSLTVYSKALGPDHEALALINQHTNSTLKELQLKGIGYLIESNLLKKVCSMLTTVETLDFCNYYFRDKSNEMLSIANQLKVLRIVLCRWNRNAINVRFPRLKEAQFIRNEIMKDSDFNQLIAFCQVLEKLTIDGNGGLTSKSFRSTGKHLSQLIELDISEILLLLRALANGNVPIAEISYEADGIGAKFIDNEIVKYLAQLKKMKKFELSKIGGLTDVNMLELAMGWPQIERIVSSNAINYFKAVGLKNIVKHAKKLKYLKFNDSANSCTVNVNDYEEMLRLVQNRSEAVQLSIVCWCYDRHVFNVPESIFDKNREWLLIEDESSD